MAAASTQKHCPTAQTPQQNMMKGHAVTNGCTMPTH
jgi:hypothetical protein